MYALERFIKIALDSREGRLFRKPFDKEWRSLCEHYQEKNYSYWSPFRQEAPVSFAGLENALEIEIHPDIKKYYGKYLTMVCMYLCVCVCMHACIGLIDEQIRIISFLQVYKK